MPAPVQQTLESYDANIFGALRLDWFYAVPDSDSPQNITNDTQSGHGIKSRTSGCGRSAQLATRWWRQHRHSALFKHIIYLKYEPCP